MQHDPEEMLTAQEVASEMKVHVHTVRNWVKMPNGLVKTKIGIRSYRIKRADLDDFKSRMRDAPKANH